MTMADQRCECCGHTDYPAGVASLSIGAMSIFWCQICLAHGAEPKWALEGIFEAIPNEDVREGILYYEPEDDTYREARTGELAPITFKDGTECSTRTSAVSKIVEISA